MNIREIQKSDLPALLSLYTKLHENPMPAQSQKLDSLWQQILHDPNHHILLGFVDSLLVSSCVLVIIPNLTNEQRPYALIENVVTHPDYRGNGHASALLAHAVSIATQESCYKVMLMTGSKEAAILQFYQNAGFNCIDKTAFIRWLP